jgi:hypothetical protein
LLALPLLGCVTAPPVNSFNKLPADTAAVCASHCGSLGMQLGAVVIVRDSTGCVCQPKGAAPSAGGGASAAVGGMLAVLDEEAARRQQQNHRRQQQRQATPASSSAVNGLGGWHR